MNFSSFWRMKEQISSTQKQSEGEFTNVVKFSLLWDWSRRQENGFIIVKFP